MKSYEYILFDLDGTLTNSEGGIKRCINYAMTCLNMDTLSDDVLNSMIGPPFVVSMKRLGMDDATIEKAIKYYRMQYEIDGWFDNKVYDGIEDMLAVLKEKGYKLALATSKPMKFTLKIMDYFNLSRYFDFIGAADTDNKRGSKIEVINFVFENMKIVDKKRVIMLGDRLYDVEGAKLAGIDSGGVLWGFGDREELENAGANYIFESPNDVKKFFT
ncbi:MAG: HAD hydrolase-like protein [Christensenellales bacterium]